MAKDKSKKDGKGATPGDKASPADVAGAAVETSAEQVVEAIFDHISRHVSDSPLLANIRRAVPSSVFIGAYAAGAPALAAAIKAVLPKHLFGSEIASQYVSSLLSEAAKIGLKKLKEPGKPTEKPEDIIRRVGETPLVETPFGVHHPDCLKLLTLDGTYKRPTTLKAAVQKGAVIECSCMGATPVTKADAAKSIRSAFAAFAPLNITDDDLAAAREEYGDWFPTLAPEQQHLVTEILGRHLNHHAELVGMMNLPRAARLAHINWAKDNTLFEGVKHFFGGLRGEAAEGMHALHGIGARVHAWDAETAARINPPRTGRLSRLLYWLGGGR
jgi:hypothetical protein